VRRTKRPRMALGDSEANVGADIGSPADPASLGVSALLLSCEDPLHLNAARRQASYLKDKATRFTLSTTHTAISHRDEPSELWGDFVYMVPPFLAYYGAATADVSFIEEAVPQCELYARVLETTTTLLNESSYIGLWRHMVSQPEQLELEVCCNDADAWLARHVTATVLDPTFAYFTVMPGPSLA
jgi:hypothetical protein